MTQRAVVDANIFVSRTIMDWLFHLRSLNEGMFQLHATEDVVVEAQRAVRRRSPRAPGTLLTDLMEKIRDCVDEVLPSFPGDLEFSGTDEGDYHVHAAAISSRADLILTQNSSEDITQTPDDEPYEIYSPDDFFMLVLQSNPACLLPCTEQQLAYWGRRGDGQLDDRLIKAGCQHFAEEVRQALKTLARAP